ANRQPIRRHQSIASSTPSLTLRIMDGTAQDRLVERSVCILLFLSEIRQQRGHNTGTASRFYYFLWDGSLPIYGPQVHSTSDPLIQVVLYRTPSVFHIPTSVQLYLMCPLFELFAWAP